MQTVRTWFKDVYDYGTVKKGEQYELIREPTPEKKMYKLSQINTKFEPRVLYLRKSGLNKHFKLVQEDKGE